MNSKTLTRARFGLAGLMALLGLAAATAPITWKWQVLTLVLFCGPLLCQFIKFPFIQAASLWFGFFLSLQTLLSPFIPGINYFTLPANFHRTIFVHSGLPGIEGPQTITTDQYGYRTTTAIDYKSDIPFRIFAIGASTTEELMLDDHSTWASQLQNRLTDQTGLDVEVVNTGLSGLRSRHHLATLKKILPLNPDMAVFLVGVNDWNQQIRQDNVNLPQRVLGDYTESFALPSTMLGKVFGNLKLSFGETQAEPDSEGSEIADEYGEYFTSQRGSLDRIDVRQYRPMEVSRSFEKYMSEISELCQKSNLACVFITQPNGYSPDSAQDFLDSFWMTPPNEAYTLDLESLEYVANLYNDYLLSFAQTRDHYSCDLAAEISPSLDNYYDDCHFNTVGASLVAEAISTCLTGRNLLH